MKKIALFSLLLAVVMALTACGSAATFAEVKTEDYLTLGDYKGLTYKVTDTTVSDYDLQNAVNAAIKEAGYTEETDDTEITKGVVQIGDTINLDYKGLKDGVAFEGGTAQGQSLTIGSGQFIDGFEEGLVGVEIGSFVKLNLTFPENYGKEELNGQDVVFEVTVNSVTSRTTYPELTDKLAKELNEEAETADEYLKLLKKELEATNIADAETELKNTLWNKAIANATFKGDLPEKLVDLAKDEFVAYYESLADQYGYDDLDSLLTGSNISADQFSAQATSYAEGLVQSQLVAYAIAKAEGFTVTEDIFDATAATYATSSGYATPEKYIDAVGKDAVRDQALLDYAVDLVLENAKAEK